jgi:hypothetical protein
LKEMKILDSSMPVPVNAFVRTISISLNMMVVKLLTMTRKQMCFTPSSRVSWERRANPFGVLV